jgi:flavin reductase (DIM6/NTAB) family NADH-FMN oxidoreductase RutF
MASSLRKPGAHVDPGIFRQALGAFATGVTVITTLDGSRQPVGVTSSSFNSVSLDPPLVVWSLRRESRSLAAFRHSGRFAVHVLRADQRHLSATFAASGADKFAGLAWERSPDGTPDLGDCAARFECDLSQEHDGGDHVLFLGAVRALRTAAACPPLVFHGGGYAELSLGPYPGR